MSSSEDFNDISTNVPADLSESNIHLLVADDNKANRAILEQILSRMGVRAQYAHNGKLALEMVRSKSYDMILMDIQMPEMDGFHASKSIRSIEDPYFQQVPIIALSAHPSSDTIAKIQEAGMNDCIGKPFDTIELFNKVLEHSSKIVKKDPIVIDVDSATLNEFKELFPYLYQVSSGDHEMILEIIETIIETIEIELKNLSLHHGNSDFEKCSTILHTIKPNIASLDLPQLAGKCEELEEAASTGNQEFLKSNLNEFIKSISEKMSAIEKKVRL